MKITVQLVKAFTKDSKLGNPAGVVHDADGLSDGQLLAIAQELGFSESAFIQESAVADFKVRFFGVTQEVDFCGHATVATFHSLREQGKLGKDGVTEVTQETKAGVFPVICQADGKIMMNQGQAKFGKTETDRKLIAGLLGLWESDLPNLPIQVVATAVPKLIVPVTSLEALRKVQPNLDGISKYCQQQGVKGFYVFTAETLDSEADFVARSFNPLAGIDEDPATGVAAGPLACYADKYIIKGVKQHFIIEQGFTMGQDSIIYVELAEAIQVGGYAASFGTRELEI